MKSSRIGRTCSMFRSRKKFLNMLFRKPCGMRSDATHRTNGNTVAVLFLTQFLNLFLSLVFDVLIGIPLWFEVLHFCVSNLVIVVDTSGGWDYCRMDCDSCTCLNLKLHFKVHTNSFRFLWPFIVSRVWREKTNKMQQLDVYY